MTGKNEKNLVSLKGKASSKESRDNVGDGGSQVASVSARWLNFLCEIGVEVTSGRAEEIGQGLEKAVWCRCFRTGKKRQAEWVRS